MLVYKLVMSIENRTVFSLTFVFSLLLCYYVVFSMLHNIHEFGGQPNGTRSHSILINLFIKLELNNFLLPPLLSIVFVQECSVVFRNVFDEGRLERRFCPKKWGAWVQVRRAHHIKD